MHHSFCNFVVELGGACGREARECGQPVGNTDVVHRLSTRPKGSGRSVGLVHKSTDRGWIMRQVPNFAAVLQRGRGQ